MALLDYKLSVGYDFDQQHAEEDERRVADTFRVISLSFSNLGGPEVIGEYYSTNGNRSYEDRIYQNLGEFYFDKLRYTDAAAVYDSFVERYPYHRVSPEFGMRVDRHLRRRRLPEARRRVEEVVRDEVRLAGRVLAALRLGRAARGARRT